MLKIFKDIVRNSTFRIWVILIPTWVILFHLKIEFGAMHNGYGSISIVVREGMGKYRDVFLNFYILSVMLSLYDAAFIAGKETLEGYQGSKIEKEQKVGRKLRAKKATY
jgi:hypothetical protein